MIQYHDNPNVSLDNIYVELFIQEYNKLPKMMGSFVLEYTDRELYKTALYVFDRKMRPVYESKGVKVRF